jgi:hypothetical protein
VVFWVVRGGRRREEEGGEEETNVSQVANSAGVEREGGEGLTLASVGKTVPQSNVSQVANPAGRVQGIRARGIRKTEWNGRATWVRVRRIGGGKEVKEV